MVELREITNQLDFPEGPIALDDGSVIVVEIAGGKPAVLRSRADLLCGRYETGEEMEPAARGHNLGTGPTEIASLYSQLGENDLAVAFLDVAYDARHPYLAWVKVNPRFDNLRADTRFLDLMSRMGVTE